METLNAGLDIGSTGVKLLVSNGLDQVIFDGRRSTPWTPEHGSDVVLEAQRLTDTLLDLLTEASQGLTSQGFAKGSVRSLGITGMGETGFLVNSQGCPAAPAFAWFDRRGEEEVKELPDDVRKSFGARTGIPFGAQVSVAKIAWLKAHGVELGGLRWLSVPEYAAYALGGEMAAEPSLAARTGLMEVESGKPWLRLHDALGLSKSLVPDTRHAGSSWGDLKVVAPDSVFSGARLTVAGHDHLVAAHSIGWADPSVQLVSMGTAEVLLRSVSSPLTSEARTTLTDALINCVPGVYPGQFVLVAGIKSGLLMRRALELTGMQSEKMLERLDHDAATWLRSSSKQERSSVRVTGARNDDGLLKISIFNDGVRATQLFTALLEHGNDELLRLEEILSEFVEPATSTVLTGGWAKMESILEARSKVLVALEASTRDQDAAFGASMIASRRSR